MITANAERSTHRELACPSCRSTDVRRSQTRRAWERAVAQVLPLRPYRCRDCNRRRWRLDPGRGRTHLTPDQGSGPLPCPPAETHGAVRRDSWPLVVTALAAVALGVLIGRVVP